MICFIKLFLIKLINLLDNLVLFDGNLWLGIFLILIGGWDFKFEFFFFSFFFLSSVKNKNKFKIIIRFDIIFVKDC